MEKLVLGIVLIGGLVVLGFSLASRLNKVQNQESATNIPFQVVQVFKENIINLPQPKLESEISLEEAIFKRRSRRDYQDKPLTLEQISQILWAGQGITDEETGFRTAPSAGALYPLDIYLVAGEEGVESLEGGVYHFIPQGHKIERLKVGDFRKEVMRASLSQEFIAQAPIVLIITGEYERTTGKYGERGRKYVHMEAGHAAQNIYLEVESLDLGTVTVGGFDGKEIIKILNLPPSHEPLYVMPIGYCR